MNSKLQLPSPFIVLCLALLVFISLSSSKLLHSSIMFRHGARTTGNYYEQYQKYFLGIAEQELTPNGFTQELLLGRYLRFRYGKSRDPRYRNFLPKKFNETFVNFKVSETQRTIFSSIGLMSGLYSDAVFLIDKGNVSNHNLPPINFNFNVSLLKNETFQVVPMVNDTFFHAKDCLPKTDILYNYTEDEIKLINNLESLFPEIIQDIRQNGYKIKNVKGFIDVVNSLDNLISNYSMDIYDQPTQELFRKTVLYSWYKTNLNEENTKLSSTLLLQDLIQHISACTMPHQATLKFLSGEPSIYSKRKCLKLNFYALHDTNIVEVLQNLLDPEYLSSLREEGIKNETIYHQLVPPYATSLIFELHTEKVGQSADLFIKIVLNGEEPFKKMRNYSYDAKRGLPLVDFLKLVESRLDEDVSKFECRTKVEAEGASVSRPVNKVE